MSTPTLIEILEPLKKATHLDRILVTMVWSADRQGQPALAIREVRQLLTSARVRNASRLNISEILGRAGSRVDRDPVTGLWSVTQTGREHLARQFGFSALSDVPPDSLIEAGLRGDLENIDDEVARSYAEEAIRCLEVEALRAAVVFLWSGCMRVLQELALAKASGEALTDALQKHDPRIPRVTKIDDFTRVKDRVALLGFRDIGLLDKGEWSTLQEALDLRNRCGHPTKYRPGVAKARAFVEDLTGIVFRGSLVTG